MIAPNPEAPMILSRRRFVHATSLSAGVAALLPERLLADQATRKVEAPEDLRDWAGVQRLFGLSPSWVHASLFFLASHPRPVREAIERYRRELDENPHDTVEHHGFAAFPETAMAASVAAVARYVGGRPDDVALTNSTTGGLTLLHHGLPLKAGDEVLTTAHDHVVHHEAIRTATGRSGATWRRVPLFTPHDASAATEASLVGALRAAIVPRTRVLAVTWVHSSSGLKLPITAVAAMVKEVNASRPEAERVLLVVDGVHGIGTDETTVAASGVDAFAAGLHKWMLGPRGTGFVWAKPEVWARMHPVHPSFASLELYDAWADEKPAAGPAKAGWFGLGGFQAYEHVWAIPAAVELHERIGRARVAARIRELNGAARQELSRIGHVRLRTPLDPALSAGITAFEVDGLTPDDVVKRLREKKIIATTSPYKVTYPRLSFGLANSEADVEKSVAAVRSLRA
jgi:isopenicillin-N epimerase